MKLSWRGYRLDEELKLTVDTVQIAKKFVSFFFPSDNSAIDSLFLLLFLLLV